MSNYSPKVIKYLKDNPDFEKSAKKIYTAAKKFADEFKSVKNETKSQIEKKFGATIDANKLANFANTANKLSEHEFVTWMAGDADSLPANQLTQAEMAMVQGGGWWGAMGSYLGGWWDGHSAQENVNCYNANINK